MNLNYHGVSLPQDRWLKPTATSPLRKILSGVNFMSKKEHMYGKRWAYGKRGISVIIVRTQNAALRPELIIDANTSL